MKTEESPARSTTPEGHSSTATDQFGLPEPFLERLSEILAPEDVASTTEAIAGPRSVSFRVNTLLPDHHVTVDALRTLGLSPRQVAWFEQAYTVPADERDALISSDPYQSRRVYIQNLSSMIPPLALDPQPGEEILDLTAAPGSKTHQMACAMNNEGRITAVESVRGRYYKLRDNMESLGAECVRPFFQDGTRTWRHRPEFFDRVLLDAPCSSEGRFRTDDPETTRYWSLKKVGEMSRKQRRLLYSGIMCLKPGGTLVYSTCSFSPEENEVVVQRLLSKFEGAVRLAPIAVDLPQFRPGLRSWQGREFDEAMLSARRIVPDHEMDGFFVCRMEKVRSTAD